MTYAYPNTTGPLDLFSYPNAVSNGLFWPLMLFVVFLTLFITLRQTTTTMRAFASSSFITAMISIPLAGLSWVNPGVTFAFLVLTAAGILIIHNENG